MSDAGNRGQGWNLCKHHWWCYCHNWESCGNGQPDSSTGNVIESVTPADGRNDVVLDMRDILASVPAGLEHCRIILEKSWSLARHTSFLDSNIGLLVLWFVGFNSTDHFCSACCNESWREGGLRQIQGGGNASLRGRDRMTYAKLEALRLTKAHVD